MSLKYTKVYSISKDKSKASQLNFVTCYKISFVLFENMYKIPDFNLYRVCLDEKQIAFYLPKGSPWHPRTLDLKEWLSSFFCLKIHDGWVSHVWHTPRGTDIVVNTLYTNSYTLAIMSLPSCFKGAYQNANK